MTPDHWAIIIGIPFIIWLISILFKKKKRPKSGTPCSQAEAKPKKPLERNDAITFKERILQQITEIEAKQDKPAPVEIPHMDGLNCDCGSPDLGTTQAEHPVDDLPIGTRVFIVFASGHYMNKFGKVQAVDGGLRQIKVDEIEQAIWFPIGQLEPERLSKGNHVRVTVAVAKKGSWDETFRGKSGKVTKCKYSNCRERYYISVRLDDPTVAYGCGIISCGRSKLRLIKKEPKKEEPKEEEPKSYLEVDRIAFYRTGFDVVPEKKPNFPVGTRVRIKNRMSSLDDQTGVIHREPDGVAIKNKSQCVKLDAPGVNFVETYWVVEENLEIIEEKLKDEPFPLETPVRIKNTKSPFFDRIGVIKEKAKTGERYRVNLVPGGPADTWFNKEELEGNRDSPVLFLIGTRVVVTNVEESAYYKGQTGTVTNIDKKYPNERLVMLPNHFGPVSLKVTSLTALADLLKIGTKVTVANPKTFTELKDKTGFIHKIIIKRDETRYAVDVPGQSTVRNFLIDALELAPS